MKMFPAVRIEGGLFAPDLLDQLLAAELPGQKPQDFGLDRRRSLTDEIAAAFADAQALWRVFQHRLERLPESDLGTTITRDAWVIPFLGGLNYELHFNRRAYTIGGSTFAISHRAGEAEDAPPVHIVGLRQELGRLAPSGRPRLAPHSLVQEFLNRTEALWGLVTNGKLLRLLRNSTFIRRQCYVEFDLEAIFEQRLFQDFAVLYRLLHRTRLPHSGADAPECLLEQYYKHSVEQGGRVRDRLRDGVEKCLKRLAHGFFSHPHNEELRRRVQAGDHDPHRISPEELYRQLLRLVYRFLFLLVSEDRGLISQNLLYVEHYSVSRLRRLVDAHTAYTDDVDLWLSLRVLWKILADDRPVQQIGGQPLATLLDLPVLNGELFDSLEFDACLITNRDLLNALWYLINYRESDASPPRRVNYGALDVEELGSVYESLLDYRPQISTTGPQPHFDLVQGSESERRSTGSYYTPAELVNELIRSALEPVMQERLTNAAGSEEKKRALLTIKVLDPACGSGHFLLAAARRLGKELARIETGEEEPPPERVREAVREVVAHCLYGVDRNPLAVELCRVALWLEAHCAGKPLTFLDHRIRSGDSLVGVADLAVLAAGIPNEALRPAMGDDREVVRALRRQNQAEKPGQFNLPFDAGVKIRTLAEVSQQLDAIADDTPENIRHKAQLLREREQQQQRESLACHLWTAAFFQRLARENLNINAAITTSTLRRFLEAGSAHGQALGMAEELAHHWRFFHWPLEFPEVMAVGGFDVVLGNPPFMGGLRISGTLGERYRHWLEFAYEPYGGTADLCAVFYRRAFALLKPGGRLGMVATNSIGQGDTRESGLAVMVRQGGTITFARRFVTWPGSANVEVNLVSVRKADPAAPAPSPALLLDGQPVEFISSRLDPEPEAEPRRLRQNENKAFIGDYVRGIGFVLEAEEAERLLARDPRYADCLFPYLNGEDLNSHPEQQPSRWVICFHDWELEQAEKYTDAFNIVKEKVKPYRESLRNGVPGYDSLKEHWWQYAAYAKGMRAAIAPLRRVLIRSRVSELHAIIFVPHGWVYNEQTVVFAFDGDYHFALLQSNVHEVWLRKQASSLRTDVRYTPTDCFATFPFPPMEYELQESGHWQPEALPEPFAAAARLGAAYHEHRRQIMLQRQLGLTRTYNLFHDPGCTDHDIVRLRELQAAMDRAVLACYDWGELDLEHGFYQNERGQTRFTVSPGARRELLRRLLDLNLRLAAGSLAPGSVTLTSSQSQRKKS